MITTAGFEVVEAESADEAIVILEEVEDRDTFVTAHECQSVGYAADALGVIARYETAPR
jgi:hypothetical protein